MAEIYLALRDVSDRKDRIASWLNDGDTVLVTDAGEVIFRLAPTERKPVPNRTKPRVFGQRPGAAVMSDDFNDPLPPEYCGGGPP